MNTMCMPINVFGKYTLIYTETPVLVEVYLTTEHFLQCKHNLKLKSECCLLVFYTLPVTKAISW